MFYEERVISAMLHRRYHPTAPWEKIPCEELTTRLLRLRHELQAVIDRMEGKGL